MSEKWNMIARRFGTVLLCSCLLSGCGARQTEQENLIILEQDQADVQYNLAVASVGDVIKIKKIRCDYQQMKGMDLSFPISGKQIKKVYVNAGDSVTEGQLLAELEIGNVDSKIRDLEYRIERNNLLLQHVDENENNEISSKWLDYLYKSEHSDEKEEAVKESVAKLQQKNEYSREDYVDAIALDTFELEAIQKDIEEGRLYAEMDGTVSYVKADLEGTTSKADERIISIIDGTEGIFVASDVEYVSYFTEGTEVEVNIISGSGAVNYRLVPYKMTEWGEKQWFIFAEDEDGSNVKVGDIGSLKVVLGMREQVLNVPLKAVHSADGKDYVYVVGEGNVREVKWIETGFYGDDSVEVISGLAEGEKVILK